MAKRGSGRRGGNSAALKRYWTSGAGAARVRWGTAGDWRRCVRAVSKYMGPRAKGYCQLRHMQATGMTTSQHAARGRRRGRR